jgi:hydroxyacylglutathione hydrolase
MSMLKFQVAVLPLILAVLCGACSKEEEDQGHSGTNETNSEPYVPVEVISNAHTVTYLEPRTYIIEETQSSQGNVCYLILGEERAVMFDTGAGENTAVDGTRMRYVIDQITDLPVTLLMSHFHFDHNQNISEFDHVAFMELEYLVEGTSAEGVYVFSDAELVSGSYPASVEVNEWWPPDTDIDLGGRSIQVVSIPGHTDESAMIVDAQNKLMFMGDYIYDGPLFVFGQQNLIPYQTTVDMLIANYDDSFSIYGAHGTPQVPHGDLQKLKDILVCIDEGECIPSMTNMMGYLVQRYNLNGMWVWVFLE